MMPSTTRIVLAALACIIAPAMLPAQPGGPDTARRVLELALDPAAVMSRPLGALESVRGNAPCAPCAAATDVNFGISARASYVFGGLDTYAPQTRIRAFSISAGYDDLSSLFESSSQSSEGYDTLTGRAVSIQSRHSVAFSLYYIRTAAELELAIGGGLLLRGGPSLGIPVSGSSREREMVVSPSNATFTDRTQEHEIPEGTGELNDLGMRLGIGASIAYRLPLGTRLFFEPQIGVDVGLTPLQPAWSQLLVRGGISLGYAMIPQESITALPPDVVQVSPETFTSPPPFAVTPAIEPTTGAEPIAFRRQIVARYVPVLPSIFFDQNSSALPTRYARLAGEPGRFSEQGLPGNAEAAHHQTLNIVGRRLVEHPRARVTITGATSQDEENRMELAQARAEAVAAYLADVWGIDRRRVTVRSRFDPAIPSSSEYPEGRQENRRVDIEASQDEIYRPVQLRSVEPTVEPAEIAFRIGARPSRGVERWRVEIATPGRELRTIEGSGTPGGIARWALTQQERERILSSGEVSYQLVVYDSAGRSAMSARRSLPLRLDTTVTIASSPNQPDNSAEFLLVTFDFDRAELTRRGKEELASILERIGTGSSVSVTGYTDALGDPEHNRMLAAERARRVASLMPPGVKVEHRGASPEEAPYGSGSPEGRFLSRTVRVVITNPKQR